MAGTRVVPLMIDEEKLRTLESLVVKPIIEVLPLKKFQVGIVTTGSEVFYGRIQDAFGPVLREKFADLGSVVLGQTLTSDEVAMTAGAIREFIGRGADMVVVTGGMSVDPDDRTPAAIRAAGARVVSYGAPSIPGPCFCWLPLRDPGGLCRCLVCPAASCTTRPVFSTCWFPVCWQGSRSRPKKWPRLVMAVFALIAHNVITRSVLSANEDLKRAMPLQ